VRYTMMNHHAFRIFLVCQLVLGALFLPTIAAAVSQPEAQEAEPEKGPNRGRMLRDGDFAVELSIFETGVPPEFRVWVSNGGEPVSPDSVELQVKLTRLGNVVDDIRFRAEGDYLRGDTVIYEPHSFIVTLIAQYQGKTYRWEYDNFEGRTLIGDGVAKAMGISTEIAGSATLHQTIRVYGKLVSPPNAKRQIQARFDGVIKQMHVGLGELVSKGQVLITVESNESLKTYQVQAPMAGVVSEQFASAGEQTTGRTLLEITNTNTLLAELAVYPADRSKVSVGAPVTLSINGVDSPLSSAVRGSKAALRSDQAWLVLAEINNADGFLSEGLFVSGDIEVETFEVPLAVKRSGLQSFRDFTVVYAKVGEEYEVRMLELGREAGPWMEVLGGLEPGTEYVTENSYIIKADIEKSGASHDH
jgi:cobalt-zinc-cadmium efflux system membrane fusion protein